MDNIQDLVQLAHRGVQPTGETVSSFTEDYIRQLTIALEELPERSLTIGKKQKEYCQVLKEYLRLHHCTPIESKSFQEIAYTLGIKVNDKSFLEYYDTFVCVPFKKIHAPHAQGALADTFKQLGSTVAAIHEDELRALIGPCVERIFNFVLELFAYKPIIYDFRAFKDPGFERLYTNDGKEKLIYHPEKTYVNDFFRYFIDGDADYSKDYSPKAYYGSLPVSEAKVVEYCKLKEIPEEDIRKLVAIMKASRRFKTENYDGEIRYALRVQYLLNIYAMSVSILNDVGVPLHKEELCDRINNLHKQYPSLVGETSIESFVLRRKPILSSSGKQGNWCLRIWEGQEGNASRGDTAQVYGLIRSYVSSKYEETGEPVPLDAIMGYMNECGYNYPKRSLRTYVTNSGCRSVRNGNYLPPEATGDMVDMRYWYGKIHIIQRLCAECILEKGPRSRKELMAYVEEQTHHPVVINTMRRVISLRPDIFTLIGTNFYQKIGLDDSVRTKKDIRVRIPEPEKKPLEYKVALQNDLVGYLLNHGEEMQSTLTTLFRDKVPSHIKEKDSIIRTVLGDKSVFIKTKKAEKDVRITLNPIFVKSHQMNSGKDVQPAPSSPAAPAFSWEVMKKGILREIVGRNRADEAKSKAVDNVFLIFKGGRKEFEENSTFKGIAEKLFTYTSGWTDNQFRHNFCKDLLTDMEAYLKLFYKLKYGIWLREEKGFGPVRYLFMREGLLPDKGDKDAGNLSREEADIYYVADRVNRARNIADHPEEFQNLSENQISKDIHDCLVLMVYIARKL